MFSPLKTTGRKNRYNKLTDCRVCSNALIDLKTEHSALQLLERGIDCHPTSDSCVRCRHSGAISRHFYSLFLTELRWTDIYGLCNAPSVYL